MDKDRLYTVNQHNMAAFMPKEEPKEETFFGDGGHVEITRKKHKDELRKANRFNLAAFNPTKEENLFVKGGNVAGSPAYNAKVSKLANDFFDSDSDNEKWLPEGWAESNTALTQEDLNEAYLNSKNKLGISKKDNPFSKANIGGTMQGIGAAMLPMASTIGVDENNKRGLFDQLDPIHQLAGGRESAVGNMLGDAGVGLFQAGAQSGNGFMMLGGAGLKILGGLGNAMFGIKEDKEKKEAAMASINANRGFMSNAGSFDAIQGPAAMSNTDIYEGGWFSGGKADRKNQAVTQDMANAYSWADRSVLNNINNLASDQINEALRNYSAFGGYLTRPKRRRKIKR